MTDYTIGVIPGDGIGPEIMAAALQVLEAAGRGRFSLELRYEDGGAGPYSRTASNLGGGALDRIATVYDATLKGPVGLAGVRSPDGTEAGVLGGVLRTGLDAFANVRPVSTFGNVRTPLAAQPAVDYVIVRENTEGMYASRGGGVGNDAVWVDQLPVTRPGTERLVRYAFELARRRNGAPGDGVRRVTRVDKSNVLRSYAFFRRNFDEAAADYPDIEADHRYADAAAYELIASSGHFDVIATENFIGDILSDVGAATIGGLRLCPAANIGAAGAYFEPAHDSAPALAGKDAANPIAQILSAAMMLDHLGEAAAAADIRVAVGLVLSAGTIVLTGSGRPAAGLTQATAAIVAAVWQLRNAGQRPDPDQRKPWNPPSRTSRRS